MKIEGIFSSDTLNEYPICLDTYGYLGVKYTKNLMEDDDKDMYLFLKKLPSFEEVFSTFMNESVKIFRSNKNLDICLSLFYDPYFNEFYNKIKQCYFQIGTRTKKYLINNIVTLLNNSLDINTNNYPPTPKKNIDQSLINRKLKKLKDLYLNDLISLEEYKVDYNKYTKLLNSDADIKKTKVL